jgi:hypothetical protein
MAEHQQSIQRYIERLVLRERLLILIRIGARLLGLVAGGALLAIAAASLEVDRGWAAAALAGWTGIGLWAALVLPVLTRWRRAGDHVRQARLVEQHAPELRGRLVTAVERLDGPRPGESALIVQRVAARAHAAASKVSQATVHQAVRPVMLLAAAVAAVFLPLPVSLVAGGPVAVAGWWLAGVDGVEQLAALAVEVDGPEARVGDLLLRYTYPPYTGLEPRVVANSTGDILGPPGTLVAVQARTDRELEAAGLVAYDERFEATLVDERTVSAQLTIRPGEGTYHLVTYQGGASLDSRTFQITAEQDLPPEVMLDDDLTTLELALDESLELAWRARDDYGVASVTLRLDGEAVGAPLFRASERDAEVDGRVRRTPAELGLSAGDRVELQIGALDNDTVGGAKLGTSRSVELVVLGPRGMSARNDAMTLELMDALLAVLADQLVDPWPPGTSNAALVQWAEGVAGRYAPLQALSDEKWDRLPAESIEREALGDALKTGGELVRFGAIAFEASSGRPPIEDDLTELKRLHDDAITSLEDGVLALDRMLRMKALGEVVDAAERMAEVGEQLEELLAEETPDSLALLAKLEQLEAMMQELAEATAKLDEGGLKEFMNARENETRSLMEEIREAIASGDMDEARELMERLARQLQQVAEGVRDTLERQRGEGDQVMQQAKELQEELEQLEQAQRDLQEEVQQLQEESGADQAAQQARIWKEIQAEAIALHEAITAYDAGLVAADRGFSETQRAQHTLLQAQTLRAAAQLSDYRGTRLGHISTTYAHEAMVRGYKTARMMNRADAGPGQSALNGMLAHLTRIEELLDELDQQTASPEAQARAQELAERQQALQQELEAASQKASELAKDFPVRPGDMGERLEQADQRMEEASQDLGEGKPMPAQGSQGAAADRIREAREELQDAMEQAARQQQQMDQSGGQGGEGQDEGEEQAEGDPQDRDRGGEYDDRPNEVAIPGAEEFRTPEEYRRALLEGMEAEVPEEYRALKKRYFEELVRQ